MVAGSREWNVHEAAFNSNRDVLNISTMGTSCAVYSTLGQSWEGREG